MRKAAIIAVILAIVGVYIFATNKKVGYYTITEVFDGDTISVRMNGIDEKVRLIGVDTPETKDPRKPVQCFGPEASTFSHRLLDGAKIHLVADPLSSNRDRYNRLLRYVYLEDGSLYNQTLLENGYARTYLGFPFTKSQIFEDAALRAKQANTGLWAECAASI